MYNISGFNIFATVRQASVPRNNTPRIFPFGVVNFFFLFIIQSVFAHIEIYLILVIPHSDFRTIYFKLWKELIIWKPFA